MAISKIATFVKMKKFIHEQHWERLLDRDRKLLYKEVFGGMTAMPNQALDLNLVKLKSATLECLENRTESTIYRIRQTGVVYEIKIGTNMYKFFKDYDDYKENTSWGKESGNLDQPIELFSTKEITYTASENDNKIIIERKQPPRFIGEYNNKLKTVEIKEWIDHKPKEEDIYRIIKKGNEFLKGYFRNKK